ncbi:MAG: ribonuclease III [Thermodesulfobacteriota bacterium]
MKREDALKEFEGTLPFSFKDGKLLETVFVHRSYLNETAAGDLECNERLEFLGDAVLSSVMSHLLFERFPEMEEGELTRTRSKLVNKRTLAGLSKGLKLGEFLLMGRGELGSGGAENPTMLADVFEALIAAVYLDRGYDEAFSFVEEVFSPLIGESLEAAGHFDYKPRLQELSQDRFKEGPLYTVVSEEGPPHRKLFAVEVSVGGRTLGSGTGPRKKDAEQAAAAEALETLKEEEASTE